VEGIIFLAVIYFIFSAIVKKSKKAGWDSNRTQGNSGVNRAAPETVRVTKPSRKSAPQSAPMSVFTPLSPVRESYQPITSTLRVGETLEAYTGSLGGQSTEGKASAEGKTSADGKVIPEGETSSEGGVSTEGGEVFDYETIYGERAGTAAYAAAKNETTLRVLPEHWDQNALTQAVVMHEILASPKGRRLKHG
jgi:hypothetical protein